MYASSCCSHPSLILKRVITSSWSQLQGSPMPANQHLSRSSCLFPRSQHTFGWGYSPLTQYPTLSKELPTGRQTIQKWMPQLIVVSFHVMKKGVCESATFQLAFSLSRRQVDAPFFPHVSCVPRSAFLLPQALHELVSPSDWAAAVAAPASAMASCFFSLISRTRSAPEARRSISAQWGARRWQRQDQWFGEKVETGSQRFRTTDWSFFVISAVFLHSFLHAISPSNRMATQSLPPCEPRQ